MGGLVMAIALSGCSTFWTEHKADKLIAQGHPGEGVALLGQLAEQDPDNYRRKYLNERDKVTRRLLLEAQRLRQQNHLDEALNKYRDILVFDPQQSDAVQGLELIARAQRETTLVQDAKSLKDKGDDDSARRILGEVLAQNPQNADARQMRQGLDLDRNHDALVEPALKASLKKPVSLEFRNASIQAVFEVLSQSSGINFIFDNDVKPDLKTTLYARNTTIEDALNLILRTSQLRKKVLNDSTLLIYPASTEKDKQYDDLVLRTFYLNSADPKKLQDMIKTLINPKSMYVDDKLKMLAVRDNLRVIETVERLINTYDIPEPEVTLEVEILELSSGSLLNLGVQYPSTVKASVSGAAGTAGQIGLNEIQHLDRNNFTLFFPDPLAVLNLQQTSDYANLLANPHIRVRNKEKAKVMIGDKVPVITTTTNTTSQAISESVSYLDVGVKLEVEPEIHVDNDVSINVNLEVSDIVKQITTSTGLLTYQIGTRNANTVLRLHDGETQALAGLIQNDDKDSAAHVPGLGKIPLIGWLFSNHNSTHSKSEIVLLITPHVVRSLHTPGAESMEFASGTGNEVSTSALRLNRAAVYSTSNRNVVPASATPITAPAPSAPADAAPVPAVMPAPNLPPAPEGASNGRVDPGIANLKLDMVSPAQIPAGKEFTVAVMLNGQAFEQMQFDLAFDQDVDVVRANSVLPGAGFNYQQSNRTVHLAFSHAPVHSGPLLMLTLKAKQPDTRPMNIVMQDAAAKKAGDVDLLVSTALPRQLLVTP